MLRNKRNCHRTCGIFIVLFIVFARSSNTVQADRNSAFHQVKMLVCRQLENVCVPIIFTEDSVQRLHYTFYTRYFPVSVNHEVPFTSQAPYGNWDDPRKQDGCEEASVLMAMRWVDGGDLDQASAEQEINEIAAYELEMYNNFQDTSARDTMERIVKGYYGHPFVRVESDITSDDIKRELMFGHLVITPMNGINLGNPYFTPPGPEYHMILFIGYDVESNEFIVHDPGTRHGAYYRYTPQVIEASLRDYPTGHHEPVRLQSKAMIIITK